MQFRVKIVEGRQLAGANISPVCRLQCHKQAAQTRIKQSTNSPFWNETFFFSFHLPPAELFDEPIEFQVPVLLDAAGYMAMKHRVRHRTMPTPPAVKASLEP